MKSNWASRIGLISMLLFGALASSVSRAQQNSGYYHGHMWDGGWHGWLFGPLMMILLVALVVIGVVIVARWLGHDAGSRPAGGAAGKSPLDILEERFARGEIDKEEFEERRRVLKE